MSVWNQYNSVIQALPTASEAFNGAWNRATGQNASVWSVIAGFKREEGLSKNKWKEDISLVDTNQEDSAQQGSSRRCKMKDRVNRLRNCCRQYHSFENKQEYLDMIRDIAFK